MARGVERGLIWLALRRTLSPGVLAIFALLAAALVRREWAGDAARLAATDADALERGLARAGVWLGLLPVALAATLGRAAGLVGRWRAGEANWLAPRALPRGGAVLSMWLGVVLAGLALLLAAACCAELAAGGAPPTHASGGLLEGRGVARLDGGRRVRFELEDPRAPTGARLSFELGLRLDSGVAGELALRARRAGAPGSLRELRRSLGSAARLELEVPPGRGPVEIELERLGDGALFVLAPRAELWLPAASEALGSVGLWARAGIALAVLAAAVLGLAAWTRPALGVALAGSLALALWLSGAGPSPLAPGSDLGPALAAVQAGRVPGGMDAMGLIWAVLVAATGLLLAIAGHSPWGRRA